MTQPTGSTESAGEYQLRLFIAGRSPSSVRAVANLRRICAEHLSERGFQIEVIDVLLHPAHAEAERVSLTPILLKDHPLPRQRIVGDLSNTDAVLQGLDMVEVPEPARRSQP